MDFNKFFLFLFLILPVDLVSQNVHDTLINKQLTRLDSRYYRVVNSSSFRKFEVPAVLLTGAFVAWPFNQKFTTLRDHHTPSFNFKYDDYLQYLPAVAMLTMKAVGVEGRSSWGEMLTADAFSIVLVAGIVNALKYTTIKLRPDESTENSFPSGHSAIGFMTATMFHKEYGHLSPWYSIGAYSIATATGVGRILNNRHWVSDVLAGASIGILSVEVGYILSDLIFKKPKPSMQNEVDPYYSKAYSPSFLSIYTGVNNFMGRGINQLQIRTSGNIGIEGAWFMNPYLGIGGQATASIIPLSLDEKMQEEEISMLSGAVGAYFSYPLSTRWRIGSKALFSMNHVNNTLLLPLLFDNKSMHYAVQTGLSISYQTQHHFGIRIFSDYKYLPVLINNYATHIVTVGAAFEIML